eukprot:363093-Chlamydomonas_euryale.AAC.2
MLAMHSRWPVNDVRKHPDSSDSVWHSVTSAVAAHSPICILAQRVHHAPHDLGTELVLSIHKLLELVLGHFYLKGGAQQ